MPNSNGETPLGDPSPESSDDPVLQPFRPYDPAEFDLFPDLLPEHRQIVEQAQGDYNLMTWLNMRQKLESMRGTPGEPTDIDTTLNSLNDRIMLRKTFLGRNSRPE